MKPNIQAWAWIASNDSALEFVYFLEALGTDISFEEIYKYCDLQEKLKIRDSITTSENCNDLAINYRWKTEGVEDASLFADAILTLSLILIDCHNKKACDLTIFTGAEKTITIQYDRAIVETLLDSLELLNTHLLKFFGFSFYTEEDQETKDARVATLQIKEALERILD